MTKLKSKKMSKSTFAVIIMAILMVAMLAFGGTYAYFTATSAGLESKTFTAGNVEITSNSTEIITAVRSDLKIVPGAEIINSGEDGLVITNKSNVKTYVFITFEAEANEDYWVLTDGEPEKAVVVDVTSTGWTQLGTSNVYYVEAEPITTENVNLEAFKFTVTFNRKVESNKADGVEESNVVIGEDSEDTVAVMNTLTVTVGLKIQSIQHEGFVQTGEGDTLKSAVQNAYDALNQ